MFWLFLHLSYRLFPFFLGPSGWILQQENVCYGFGKSPVPVGSFTIKGKHNLVALRLVHVSGDLACSGLTPAKWGSRISPCNSDCFSTFLQFENGTFLVNPPALNSKSLFTRPGFTIDDDVLIIKLPHWPVGLRNEEGFNILSISNSGCQETGVHCINVEASFLPWMKIYCWHGDVHDFFYYVWDGLGFCFFTLEINKNKLK